MSVCTLFANVNLLFANGADSLRLEFRHVSQTYENSMPTSVRFVPGSTIRWRDRRFVFVDYAGLDAILAREIGKRRLHRVPVAEAVVDLTQGDRDDWTPALVSVPEKAWQTAVRRFKILKALLELAHAARTFAKVSKIAAALGKHPSTIYRWMEDYERTERLSVFLRKERSDRGKSRLPNKVNAIIETAIKKIYLTEEQPDVAAVIEEVHMQCFKASIKKTTPHHRTPENCIPVGPPQIGEAQG